jgi:hypothetical protein
MSETAWQSYSGIDVSIDTNGQFHVEIEGIHMREPSWERLRLRIEDELKSHAKATKLNLNCVALVSPAGVDDGECSVERLTLIGLSRTDSSFRFKEKGVAQYVIQTVLPASDINERLLNTLATATNTARSVRAEIKDRQVAAIRWAGRIESSKYNEACMNLATRFATACKASGL